MGVEYRNGRPYLYSRIRVGGKLRGKYLGRLTAKCAVDYQDYLAAQRLLKKERKRDLEAIGQRAAAVNAAAYEFDNLSDLVFRATMHVLGFHQHHRSEWRKQRRGNLMPTPDDMDSADDDDDDDFDPDERPKVQPPLLKPLGDTPELKKVLARAARGDTSVLPAVRKLLTDPAVQRLLGDVAEQACDRLIFVVSGDDLAVSEAVRIHTQAMLTNLLADSSAKASFLEQVAARRVIHTWLAVHALEILWAMKQSGTDSAERIARHLCTAERRLEAAMKSLAVLRRLALPAITAQLNVATGSMVVNNHATSSSNAEGIDAP